MKYIKFHIGASKKKKSGLLRQMFYLVFSKVLPVANPDFENKISEVEEWLVEFENDHSLPSREIGLNDSGKVIAKMPYKSNYGYWCDNNLIYDDFEKLFSIKKIDVVDFEKYWNEFQ